MVSQIYHSELQLNKANTTVTKAAFLGLHLSISTKKNPAVKFFELFFRNNFFIFNLAKCVPMKVVEETFRQPLQNVWCLWCKQIIVYTDEDFAINGMRSKFLSLLLTGKIRIGVTERGSLKKYS